MSDLFQEKAQDWDARPVPLLISEGVGAAILEHVHLAPDLQVMDFGAGTGLICARVAPHVGKVYAVDISAAMLEKLSEKHELRGKVETRCQDILQQPLGVRLDLIMSAMAMHHVEDTAALFEAFAAHLTKGGQLALADLDQEDGTFHPEGTEGVYHQGFDREVLRGLLERAGFGEIAFVTATRVPREGREYPIFLVTAKRS